jgi:phospholipid/cholesterol/gamma-HCH transport system substrate-binding protein
MVKKKTYFTVGLFVVAGVCLGVGALVWIGASQYFQKGARYSTYFNESVQGLQVDSSLKYLGVGIGRVEKIKLAPDFQLIEVVMKIDFPGDLSYSTVATLKMAGLTGIVYVELDKRTVKDAGLSPKLTFTSEYPVIPSKSSEIKQITTSIDEIIQKIKSMDFSGIADQIKSTTKAIETFVTDEKMKKIVANLDSTAANIQLVTARLNQLTEKGALEKLLLEATETMKDARTVIARAKGEIDALNISSTAGKLQDLIDGTDRRVRSIAVEIQATSENLKRASETLEDLLERLKTDPSQLIFSEPPPQDKVK